jgi:AI-2 transport protein TqsA
MADTGRLSRATRTLLVAACFVVVVAGMHAASSIIVPFLLSVFIAIIFAPFLVWMRRVGVPKVPAVLLVIIAILAISAMLATFVGVSVNAFVQALPEYEGTMDDRTKALFDWLKNKGLDVSQDAYLAYLAPSKAMSLTGTVLSGLKSLFGNGLIILLTVAFLLVEASSFVTKFRVAVRRPEQSLAAMERFGQAAQRYVLIKTATSALTGVAVWIALLIIGVDYPVIWALLAFLLNFVPYVGPVLSAIPPILLALVQPTLGVWHAVAVFLSYGCINTVFSILEPRLMAGGLGLSPLVVFLSFVFWGWALGPVGSVISAPLTIIVKIALESSDDTRWIAVLLGPEHAAARQKQSSSAPESDA